MRQRDLELLLRAFTEGMEWDERRKSATAASRYEFKQLLEFGIEVGKERGMRMQRDAHDKRRKR